MTTYILLLRLIHILSGVFWAGATIMLAGFVEPVSHAIGPDGAKFMQRLMGGKLPLSLTIAGPLTVLAGILLYWQDSAGLSSMWILSNVGIGFTVGGVAGIVAFLIGVSISRPTAAKMGVLGKATQTSGKPPSPEQLTQLNALQRTMSRATLWNTILISIALIAMAVARYL
jgi:hypothetical protein